MNSFLIFAVVGVFQRCFALRNVNIGFLIDDFKLEQVAKNEIDSLSLKIKSNLNISYSWHKLSSDPTQAFSDICTFIIGNKSYAIITTDSEFSGGSSQFVSYIGTFYKIPVVGLQIRKIEFSDKNLHPIFLRMVPAYTEQARVWSQIMETFSWKKINVLTSDDHESRIVYIEFTSWAYQSNIVIENSVQFPSGLENILPYMASLNESQSRVFYVICSAKDAITVYKTAKKIQLTGKGYIWLVNEEALDENALKDAPQGTLSIRLSASFTTEAYLKDAIQVVISSLNKMEELGSLIKSPPSSCNESTGTWITGEQLYKILTNTSSDGYTGIVDFDWYGDRKNIEYDIINVDNMNLLKNVGCVIGRNVSVNFSKIIWPGNQVEIPKSIVVSNYLKVVTIESNPFIIAQEMHPSNNCSRYGINYVLCTGPSLYDKEKKNHCCKGYCIDLLNRLSERLKFTYSLYLVEDGSFGSLIRVNSTSFKKWNGIIGDLVEGKADLAVGSLTINNERAQYIELSKPFKYQGLSILIKKTALEEDLLSFLRPFKPELWLLVLLSVHIVAIILYLLDKFSPFGKDTESDKEELPLDISSTMWFAWGVLLNSGVGEGTPRSFSARILAMVWAGFSMIIIASYTANLAAFLVLDKPKSKVEGIDDPVLRNPSLNFKYATVQNSSAEAYFRRQVEMSSMYTFMKEFNVQSEGEGIAKVKSGELDAFIWDSPVLYHETSIDCNLLTVDLFARSGYGIGTPRDSPWSDDISLSILNFHEHGIMEELETRWISFGTCNSSSDSSKLTKLGLNHMLGVFIMVAVGIGAGIIIVIFEVLYYKHKGWKKKQHKVLKQTTQRWQDQVEEIKKNRILTKQNKYFTHNQKKESSMVYVNRGFET